MDNNSNQSELQGYKLTPHRQYDTKESQEKLQAVGPVLNEIATEVSTVNVPLSSSARDSSARDGK